MLPNSSAFLVLNYEVVDFRYLYSGSIDVRTEIVLSAVRQLAAVKDNLLK